MKPTYLIACLVLSNAASANQLVMTGDTIKNGLFTDTIMLPDASVMSLREIEMAAKFVFFQGPDVLTYNVNTGKIAIAGSNLLTSSTHTTHPTQKVAIYDINTDYFYPSYERQPYTEEELAYIGQVIYVGEFVPGYIRYQPMDTPFQTEVTIPKIPDTPQPPEDNDGVPSGEGNSGGNAIAKETTPTSNSEKPKGLFGSFDFPGLAALFALLIYRLWNMRLNRKQVR